MKMIRFPDGTTVPALGQGTWMMAEDPARRPDEIAALREGLSLGLTLIDTAEMYADGASERLVGEAIAGVRDEVFLVSKAYPQNASRDRLPRACEASLDRMKTDRLDLYLLHWRGNVPLAETVEAMERLVEAGKILRWGVSNLDVDDMAELVGSGGKGCQTDQILYNLTRRGPEYDLLPWLAQHRMAVMAYSPVEQGRLVTHSALTQMAAERDATPAQVALAWLLARDDILPIPKAGSIAHVRDNRAALDLTLSDAELRRLDDLFPPPRGPEPLAML
ncbi:MULTISPECIES: aldo/keto reductase [unclassified Sphingomonas]|uniref:aldo/keto reductase n=1 Tax=unclassified Sphingomonas TaxID=196159 RepID=UPI0006F9F0B9|nr:MULTISPECIES: aldo/keto reductase [unclassified Sphingomonas]KQM23936.1 aldo/keto reductase [Sphingomonas sp. Leaf9]KQM42065.1 aldo/keto reductase [Sphingomonas sp. Leaf11]